MRHYEAVVIGYPQTGERADEAKKVFEEQVTKRGGTVLGGRELGRRSFGYTIKKQKEGNFVLVDFDLDPAKVSDLKKALSLSESILRSSIFIKGVAVPPSVPRASYPPPKPPISAKV